MRISPVVRHVEKCPHCGAAMTLRALLIAAESVARFLSRIGLDPNPPPVAPARVRGQGSVSLG